jgi:hypothetical protein
VVFLPLIEIRLYEISPDLTENSSHARSGLTLSGAGLQYYLIHLLNPPIERVVGEGKSASRAGGG